MSPQVWDPLAAARLSRLDNGLTLCLLPSPRAQVVSLSLWYAAGTRDEGPSEGGAAHFLEHMMFKGSARYGPGEVDRRTQALGGSNNAFTSHDATAYHVDLGRAEDATAGWVEALAMEADRMEALTLAPEEVDRERRVILEEIAMYEDEPWDALETAVQEALFDGHPYGRPVLGTRESLAALDADALRSFHRRYYRPDNAVLVLAGRLDEGTEARVEEIFGGLSGGGAGRRKPPVPAAPRELRRLVRRQGEVPRMLLAMMLPAAQEPLFPSLRLLVAVLAGGRTSRLHRRLVDDGRLCPWVSGSLSESPLVTTGSLALEVVPGEDPEHAEEALFEELEVLRREPPSAEELVRARQILAADWTFGHERAHQRGLAAGFSLTLFSLEYPRRQMEALLAAEAASPERLLEAAALLDPSRGGVLGWSLPRGGRRSPEVAGEIS